MQLLFWAGAIVVFALASSWMMVACVAAGYLLRFSHQVVIESRWFILARRYGVWGALLRSPAFTARRGWRSSGIGNVVFMPVLAVGVGFIAAFTLPGMVPFLLDRLISVRLGHLLGKTAFVDGGLGALTAAYVWIRGLGYVARPSIPRSGGLPQLWFPATLSRSARDHVSLNVYWCNRINTAALFAVIYPWLFLAVLPSGTSGSSSNVGSHSSQTVPPLLALGIIILALAPGVIARC